jgi:hypothetical protein
MFGSKRLHRAMNVYPGPILAKWQAGAEIIQGRSFLRPPLQAGRDGT